MAVTYADLVDKLDNVAAALANVLAHHGGEMEPGDRAARGCLELDARQMVAEARRDGGDPDDDEVAYIAAARERWCSDDLEIDDHPMVSPSRTNPGAWVAAWVWVANEDAGIGEDEEG